MFKDPYYERIENAHAEHVQRENTIYLENRVTELEEKLAQSESEWQPIDTAPKDGTKIWACRLQRYCADQYVCKWIPKFQGWLESIVGVESGWWSLEGECVVRPTHWMPLPKPPETGK